MKLTKLLLAAGLAGSLFATGASAFDVTLNPSASNGPLPTLNAGYGSFVTDKATTDFASLLTINSLPGAGGAVAFTESGMFLVEAFGGNTNAVTGATLGYNIYATFDISGTGSWVAGNLFLVAPGSLVINTTIWGSPDDAVTSGLAFATPACSVGCYGVTPGANDFILGTATLDQGVFASVFLGGAPVATTSLNAFLAFTPAANTSGIGGFWESPSPFNVDLSTSATGVPFNGTDGTSWALCGGFTCITTNVTLAGIGSGSGNILFSQVPEPGSIALTGLALAALGFLRRRRAGAQA